MVSINDVRRDIEARAVGKILEKFGFTYQGNMFKSKNFSSTKPYHKLDNWIVYVTGTSKRNYMIYQLNLFHLPTNSWFTNDYLKTQKINEQELNHLWQNHAKSLLLDLINSGLDFNPLTRKILNN